MNLQSVGEIQKHTEKSKMEENSESKLRPLKENYKYKYYKGKRQNRGEMQNPL